MFDLRTLKVLKSAWIWLWRCYLLHTPLLLIITTQMPNSLYDHDKSDECVSSLVVLSDSRWAAALQSLLSDESTLARLRLWVVGGRSTSSPRQEEELLLCAVDPSAPFEMSPHWVEKCKQQLVIETFMLPWRRLNFPSWVWISRDSSDWQKNISLSVCPRPPSTTFHL